MGRVRLLGVDIMQAIQDHPATTAQLADKFHCSDRHVRRILGDLPKVRAVKEGRKVIYMLVSSSSSDDDTTTITGSAGNVDNYLHNVRDRDLGHSSNTGETISDIRGHDRGHEKVETTKQRHRKAKSTAISYGPAPIRQPGMPGPAPVSSCAESGTNLCPQYYASFERDMIRFVLVDKVFHDLLIAKADQWTVKKTHGNNQLWIYPIPALTLQLGIKDTVVFHSADPGDLSVIADWVKDNLPEYGDMKSLIARIRYPQNLSGEEITVIVKNPATIAGIKTSIGKIWEGGQFNLMRPGTGIPGLRIYESKGTMRIEFLVTDHATGVNAINMREELQRLMPRIHHSPGLFWEFIQRHYYAIGHPLFIDTGGHDFLEALKEISGQFVSVLKTESARDQQFRELKETIETLKSSLTDRAPGTTPQLSERDQLLLELKQAIEDLESSELGDIIRTFRDIINAEEPDTKVFLAAWAKWAESRYKGGVGKADIASLLIRQNDPLTMPQIAVAIANLKAQGLLVQHAKRDIHFSPAGIEIAKLLMAKREGI